MARRAILAASFVAAAVACWGQAATSQSAAPQAGSATHPTLYVVAYAHLDTEWRWEYPTVIGQYIPDTLRRNFALIDAYPHYVFNFTGANRYRMMKEYLPADFERVKRYVASGRWFPAGSSVEESDVNVPSAESILRQVLYGNEFFRRELGTASNEYMLPDCFGFPATLPSLLAHAGIKGFSTQKLSWGSAAAVGGAGSPEHTPNGIPFNVGLWKGPDGNAVIAALNPGDYTGSVGADLSRDDAWISRVRLDGLASGLYADYHYYGTGDIGGAPREDSVRMVERSVTGGGPLEVVSSKADRMFLDMTDAQAAGLPRYTGDLLLTNHSAGSISSQAYQKKLNRKNELLGDAAERASVAAEWSAALPYPLKRLSDAWMLVLGGQFHDILAGTSTPAAYRYSWNDGALAMNQLALVRNQAVDAVAGQLNTETKGRALVVYNPLEIEREDVVEANLSFPEGAPRAVRVVGPDGVDVPAQISVADGEQARVVFLARVPPVGWAVFDVQPADAGAPSLTLSVSERGLENHRYRVRVDANGDIEGILDKRTGKELLSAPARLAFQTERPKDWPAWNMDWRDQRKPPRGYVTGPARVHVLEEGPARVSLRIEREAEGSRFVQTIRLAAGDAGNRIEVANSIDWKTSAAALKATFPLAASNRMATYSWDVATVQRGNNDPRKFEVPSHEWLDLTDTSGLFGLTVLSDCSYGSDKPNDTTLRLTLLYTPGIGPGNGRDYADQASQDWGHHEILYGLAGHAGSWEQEGTDWQALRLSQPLVAFESTRHAGALGASFSLLRLSTSRVRVLALKRAEQSDETVIRLVELDGRRSATARVDFAAPVVEAREIDGQERPIGQAVIVKGALVATFGPHQIRSFAVKLAPAAARAAKVLTAQVPLAFDRSVASNDAQHAAAGFDAAGRSLPAEMLPREVSYGRVTFSLAPAGRGVANAVTARGQAIDLPAGAFTRLYLLAASAAGDRRVVLRIGGKSVAATVQDWGGFIGQWDTRLWRKVGTLDPPGPWRGDVPVDYAGLVPGFMKPAPVAWFASHRHTVDGANEPYAYSYLFAYCFVIPEGAASVTVPDDPAIRILAATVSDEAGIAEPAQPPSDTRP
jgi:alpha-mannosidase